MRARLHETVALLRAAAAAAHDADLRESADYLDWLDENHFTFLGYQEYEVSGADGGRVAARGRRASALGVLREDPIAAATPTATAPGRGRSPPRRGVLVLTKASMRATVHRPSYLDYVGVKPLRRRRQR